MAGIQTTLPASTALDGTGAGQAQITAPGYDLVVTLQSISTATAVKVPTAKIYRNVVNQANFVEGSYTGSNDSSNTRLVLHAGESLICAWTGGDAGTTATYLVRGVLYPPGQAPAE